MFERSTDEHNGHSNYETWAFYTHVVQTPEMVDKAVQFARPLVDENYHPVIVGEHVIRYFRNWCRDIIHSDAARHEPQTWDDAMMMTLDVGSFWRVDEATIGSAVIGFVREEAA